MEANRANVTKFEAGKVTPGALIRYVFRLNRAEFRWIVLSMVLLAIVSVAAPIFNEQVFSVVIPNADRALMVQIFLMSVVFVAGTVALQYMNSVIGARIRRNCEWHLQTALSAVPLCLFLAMGIAAARSTACRSRMTGRIRCWTT